MKKISTLILAACVAISASAAATRPPKVVLNTPSNYDVRIDGRMYRGDDYNLRNLGLGTHTVQVYKVGSGFFKRKMLVSTEQFTLRNNDVTIDVNQFGRAKISEDRFGGRNDNRGWDNNRSTGRNDNNNHGGYGNSSNGGYGNGNGQQYPRP